MDSGINVEGIEGKLLSRQNIQVGEVDIINHKLDDIYKLIGHDKYQNLISLPVLMVSDFKLDGILSKEEIDSLTVYKVARMFEDVREMFINFLNAFTHHAWEFNDVFNEFVTHISDTERIRLNQKKVDDIFEVVKAMYCIPERRLEEVKVDKEIDNIMKEFEEFNRKTKHKEKSHGLTLDSIVLAVSTRHNTYDLFNIWNLTVFELMKTYRQLEKNDHWDNVMQGIYAGTVDSKQLDLDKIYWANK